ncbi:MAG TPA: hypothetical protein VM901_10390 [Bdellovibrionota bacterium]|jgi:4-hydroxyphenylpyruvate dioxygenase-like putative hemolysin|nr:hypothetical protein [Bdellovibrionota bacterium]
MKSLTPPLPHRFDFLEVATADLEASEAFFTKLGFFTTQQKVTPAMSHKLMVQGRIRLLLTQGAQGTYQHQYFLKNGEGICSVGYHVESAKKALHVLKQNKSVVVQDFLNEEDELMFLQSSAVQTPFDMRVTFVTRSGAPHDVLSPFAPNFQKTTTKAPPTGVGLLTFSSIMDSAEARKVQITFTCQNVSETAEVLRKRGFAVDEGSSPSLKLFQKNPAALFTVHFRKI